MDFIVNLYNIKGPPGYPGAKGDKGDRSEPQKFKKLRRRQHLALQGDGAFDETMGQIRGPPGTFNIIISI